MQMLLCKFPLQKYRRVFDAIESNSSNSNQFVDNANIYVYVLAYWGDSHETL